MTTQEYVSWKEFDRALNTFHDFLKFATLAGGPLRDYHVIFRMGTVARLSLELPEFTEYTGEYVENYPAHRIPDDELGNIIKHNIHTWELQRNVLSGDVGRAVKIAYKLLIDDKYPYPGGDGSDRFPVPCQNPDVVMQNNEILWNLIWPRGCDKLSNLILAAEPGAAVQLGGEFRRYDYMFPKVRAIITPDLTIISL